MLLVVGLACTASLVVGFVAGYWERRDGPLSDPESFWTPHFRGTAATDPEAYEWACWEAEMIQQGQCAPYDWNEEGLDA